MLLRTPSSSCRRIGIAAAHCRQPHAGRMRDCRPERLCAELVQRLPGFARRFGYVGAEVWIHDQPEKLRLARLTYALTSFDIVIDRVLERGNEVLHGITVKADTVLDSRHAAEKDAVVGVELDAGAIALVRQNVAHGCTPNLCQVSAGGADLIAFRLLGGSVGRLATCRGHVAARSWRWKLSIMSSLTNRTRDPLPSTTSQPAATSNASSADHSSVPVTGSVKMAASVRRCRAFMWGDKRGRRQSARMDGAKPAVQFTTVPPAPFRRPALPDYGSGAGVVVLTSIAPPVQSPIPPASRGRRSTPTP